MTGVTGAQLVGAKRGSRRCWPVFVVAGALCGVTPAHAAKPGQAFRLEYWASGSCPDAIEFARQVQTRAPRLRPAEGAEPALGFYTELVERKGGATGRLTARSADGREVVREVRGPTCDDVVTALALIAALAADPNQPVESAPVVHSAQPPRRVARAADRDEPPDLIAELLEEDSRAARERRWTFGVGVGLGFDSSIAPAPATVWASRSTQRRPAARRCVRCSRCPPTARPQRTAKRAASPRASLGWRSVLRVARSACPRARRCSFGRAHS